MGDTCEAGVPGTCRVLVFGAGAVGRGFVGEIFSDAGWTVSFLDVNPPVVESLRAEGGYAHHTVADQVSTRRIGAVEAGYSTDPEYVRAEIGRATAIATSVGAAVLPRIAPGLRDGLLARFRAGGAPVDILLCENLHGAAAIVRELLLDGLDAADAALLDGSTGLVETSIGRMIPVPDDSGEDPTAVAVEPYRFLPIDAAATRTDLLRSVPALVCDPEVDFAFYGDRKLYVHNLGHYLCGLLGQALGLATVADSVTNPGIRYLVRAAMLESAFALAEQYRRPLASLVDHVDDLLHRFGNRALGDTVARVVRDPQRKLAPGDRVLGAYHAARSAGLPSRHLSVALAAGALALERSEGRDPSVTHDFLAGQAEGEGLELALAQLTALRIGFDIGEQLDLLGRQFSPPRIP